MKLFRPPYVKKYIKQIGDLDFVKSHLQRMLKSQAFQALFGLLNGRDVLHNLIIRSFRGTRAFCRREGIHAQWFIATYRQSS